MRAWRAAWPRKEPEYGVTADGVSRRLIPRARSRCLPERANADAGVCGDAHPIDVNTRSYARADRRARPHAYANGAAYAYCKGIANAYARADSSCHGCAYACANACADANCDCAGDA